LRSDGTKPSILKIISQRNFWGIAIPRFLADPTWGTLTFWLPLYLNTVRHFDLKQIALTAWLPFLAADVGCMAGRARARERKKGFTASGALVGRTARDRHGFKVKPRWRRNDTKRNY